MNRVWPEIVLANMFRNKRYQSRDHIFPVADIGNRLAPPKLGWGQFQTSEFIGVWWSVLHRSAVFFRPSSIDLVVLHEHSRNEQGERRSCRHFDTK